MRGTPLSTETIAEIARLAGEGVGRNEIARQLRVSVDAVTRHAPAGSFDRTQTAEAVKARQVDMAARRAELAQDLLDDATRLREQIWQPTKIYNFGGKDNTYAEMPVDEPPFDAKRTLMQATATALNAHLRLVDHDTDGGVAQAHSVLDQFMEGIAEKADRLRAGRGE